MIARVAREYSAFYARRTGELIPNYDSLKHDWTVLRPSNPLGVVIGYRLEDFSGAIHPFVPVEFVTIIEEGKK